MKEDFTMKVYVQGFGPVNDTSDGRINVSDRDVIGNGIPDLFMG
jgi:hypothetical protein